MLAGAWFQPLLNTSYTLPEDSVCALITLPLHRNPMWLGLKRLSSMDHAIIVIMLPSCSHAVLHWVWPVRNRKDTLDHKGNLGQSSNIHTV